MIYKQHSCYNDVMKNIVREKKIEKESDLKEMDIVPCNIECWSEIELGCARCSHNITSLIGFHSGFSHCLSKSCVKFSLDGRFLKIQKNFLSSIGYKRYIIAAKLMFSLFCRQINVFLLRDAVLKWKWKKISYDSRKISFSKWHWSEKSISIKKKNNSSNDVMST